MVCLAGAGLACYAQGRFTFMTKEDGLPGEDLTGMCSAPDGGIWISTWGNGISYYDGRGFRIFSTNDVGVRDVAGIHVDSRNHVWIGTWSSGVVHYDGRQFRHYTTAEGLGDQSARWILPLPDGVVWIATDNGLTKFDGKTFANITKNKDRLAHNQVDHLGRIGRVCCGLAGLRVSRVTMVSYGPR
jgi:ligand-binding sensor domain-containing protein